MTVAFDPTDEATWPPVLLRDEAAAVARMSVGQLDWHRKHDQSFPCARFGRAVRIPRDAFLRWLEGQGQRVAS